MLALTNGHAGVTLDGALGRSGNLSGPDYAITADLGRQMGNNLFHSFSQLNLSQGESAIFSGPASIANIIGRVSGGSTSNIDGTLRSTIPAANLYLINPAGLIFGPHAQLDIGGSFYASSASHIAFSDGSRFDAMGGSNVLSTASPQAFGFLGGNIGSITVNGSQLRVGTGQQLVLAGSDIFIDGQGGGTLSAPAGRIALYSIASEGELGLSDAQAGQQAPSRYGNIRINGNERITANGSGGRIVIRAGNLQLENALLLAQNVGGDGGIFINAHDGVMLDRAIVQSATDGTARGGVIAIETGRLVAINQSEIDTSTFGRGDGGRILLNAGNLTLTEGSRISNLVTEDSTGQGGNTAIHVSGTMQVSGQSETGRLSAVLNSTFGGGNAGELTVEASRLALSGGTLQAATTDIGQAGAIHIISSEIGLDSGGLIHAASRGRGDGGTIDIQTSRLSLSGNARINTEASAGGRAGAISIQTGTLDLSDGSNISNRTYYFQRGSGDISINATESIRIQGRAEALSSSPGSDEVSTGIFSFTGNIAVTTPDLTLLDSGGISTRTWNNLDSGNLTVETDRLTLLNGGHLSADAIGHSGYHGGAGNISVKAHESILISGMAISRRSSIQSGTRSSGDAGLIEITTPRLQIENGGMINTSTGVFGEGGAGAILIQAGVLEMLSGGRILSSSNGYGPGGDITVSADSMLLDHGSISAFGSGGEGAAGQIALHAPVIIMRSGLVNTESDSGTRAGDILIEAGTLILGDTSRIKSDSSGSGNAGNVLLQVGDHLEVDNSTVTTGAAYASGGNVTIRAGSMTMANNSAITATVGGGFGDGGNVTATAEGIAAVGNSDITARADQGHGGRIVIDSKVFLHTPDVDLDASSNVTGNQGIVEVNAPKLDISGNLVVLPANFLDISGLLDNPCLGRYAGQASSLVLRARGGISLEPDGLLPANLETATLGPMITDEAR